MSQDKISAENQIGPQEKKLVEELGDQIRRKLGVALQTKKGQQKSKKMVAEWLERPIKKFDSKTARKVILEERAELGNPETKIGYSFYTFFGDSGGSELSSTEERAYNQAVTLLSNEEPLKALKKFTPLLPAMQEMSQAHRWYANVGSALAQLAHLSQSHSPSQNQTHSEERRHYSAAGQKTQSIVN